MKLYKYQEDAIKALNNGKHICCAGCLAKGTPVLMANGSYKNVEDLNENDELLSYDEVNDEFAPNKVASVFRTCHKPKPMIELEHDGEVITTTYDHPFFNGEGYYPIYQLAWGALEASQRVQLKLLCKQYGQDFNDKAVWRKTGSSNEPSKGRMWLLQDSDERGDSQGSQSCGRELAEEPRKIGMCESYQLRQGGQQSREPRVVFKKVQRLVGNKPWCDKETDSKKQYRSITEEGQGVYQGVCNKEYNSTKEQQRESNSLQLSSAKVSNNGERYIERDSEWSFKVKVSEPYYSISMQQAPYTYCIGRKHHYITHNTGSGKGAIMLHWLHSTGKKHCVVVTMASKRDSHDIENEADMWFPGWRQSQSSFTVLSWQGLAKWWSEPANRARAMRGEFAFAFDEVHCAKAGVSSARGKAFIQITQRTNCWTGYTATPGEKWIEFYPYFVAGGFVRTKTAFMSLFCNVQTFKGYPEIVSYHHEDKMKEWWNDISDTVDISEMLRDMPQESHFTINFKVPKDYKKVAKTRINLDGEMLDTTMGYCHALRQLCASKEKMVWLEDFLEGLQTNVVVFYNYLEEGDQLEELCKKMKRKVWRIGGGRHEIPTADTIGKRDVVLCQWVSGSASLNLQFMNYWISFTPNYGYATTIQAMGRVRRVGQTKPMFFYTLLCCDTIEVSIKRCLDNKSDFAESVWFNEKFSNGTDLLKR